MKLRLTLDHGVSLSDLERALGSAGLSLDATLDPGLRVVREIPEHLRARAERARAAFDDECYREAQESELVPYLLQQQAG